jgi:two-component system, NtrC family, response regulator HupR/HoxA
MSKVFFIDDEVNVLNSIKRAFRNEEFEGYYFTSAVEALEEIEKIKPEVIVSDILMPEMNGFELLQKAKISSPTSVRVMLTGYADVTTILHAMNSGEVYRFITKPWKLEGEAINIIHESIEYSQFLSSRLPK